MSMPENIELAGRSHAQKLALRTETLYAQLDQAEERHDAPETLATLDAQALEAAEALLRLVGAAEARRLRNQAWKAINTPEKPQ